MATLGQILFLGATAVGAVAGVAYAVGLIWYLIAAVRRKPTRRPRWFNYAYLAVGLGLVLMGAGLVLWGKIPWWFLLLLAPMVVLRLVVFRLGESVSRRRL